ncbi:MAG: glycosyltransferase [Magnetococcales bacterium]|nr:glycosyltransferase [Magnetococcales bacterium]
MNCCGIKEEPREKTRQPLNTLFPPKSQTSVKKRLLVFIVTYNAERTIGDVLRRIPADLKTAFDIEILIIDDSSADNTFSRSLAVAQGDWLPFPITVLANPNNLGYGGNQKVGYQYAIQRGFDWVALIHGDGQYAPECLPDLLQPLLSDTADAVLGSRMLQPKRALQGGMPRYKFVGNTVLTAIQNALLGCRLSEYHTGYRVYGVHALKKIPFHLNTNDFHFDTEIIIQLQQAGLRIAEKAIPTHYGDEICNVNGMHYAINVVKTTLKAAMQNFHVLYDIKYDCAPEAHSNKHYKEKLGFASPHRWSVERIPSGAKVLDLGCGAGMVGAALRHKGCHVTGVDRFVPTQELDHFILHDMDSGLPELDYSLFDVVLLLDVVEHLTKPEMLMLSLQASGLRPEARVIVSTGNVAFILTRLSLLFGCFNYGKRGILDMTHCRLFTEASLLRLLHQTNFHIRQVWGSPVPFPFLFSGGLGQLLLAVNRACIALFRSLFAFQLVVEASPRPSLSFLLQEAHNHAERLRETDSDL